MKKYIVEFLGTFTLALLVTLSLTNTIPVSTPVLAGLILMFYVYTIGSISGCHINPAVTIGLLSVKKIAAKEAAMYILFQFIGGFLALIISGLVLKVPIQISALATSHFNVFFAELFGTFLFTFGIASVVWGNVEKVFSGLMIGASLTLGILCAALLGSNGILNPAVALSVQSYNLIYLLAPICGSVLGMQLFSFLAILPEGKGRII